MNTTEMSDLFDELINAYSQTPDNPKDMLAFNEYQKSLFLTDAQEQLVVALYDGKNSMGNMFELTEEDRRLLSSLVRSVTLEPINEQNFTYSGYQHITPNSQLFSLPKELMFITYESCTFSSDDSCLNNKTVQVYPTTQDEFHKINKNPFRGPNGNRVLRLDIQNNTVELVSKTPIKNYFVRYIKRPRPIILVDLDGDLSIQEKQSIMDSELNSLLHEKIVRLAVQLALQTKNIKQQ